MHKFDYEGKWIHLKRDNPLTMRREHRRFKVFVEPSGKTYRLVEDSANGKLLRRFKEPVHSARIWD